MRRFSALCVMKTIIYCVILVQVLVFGAAGCGTTLKRQPIIMVSAETAQKNEKGMKPLLSFDIGAEQLQLFGDTTELAAEYALIWRKDTLFQTTSYSRLEDIVVSLDRFKWSNVFLLNSFYGDGCPALYQILSFRPDNTYYLSDEFGNCNEVPRINYRYPIITFTFDKLEYSDHPKAVYSYDGQRYLLVQKK